MKPATFVLVFTLIGGAVATAPQISLPNLIVTAPSSVDMVIGPSEEQSRAEPVFLNVASIDDVVLAEKLKATPTALVSGALHKANDGTRILPITWEVQGWMATACSLDQVYYGGCKVSFSYEKAKDVSITLEGTLVLNHDGPAFIEVSKGTAEVFIPDFGKKLEFSKDL